MKTVFSAITVVALAACNISLHAKLPERNQFKTAYQYAQALEKHATNPAVRKKNEDEADLALIKAVRVYNARRCTKKALALLLKALLTEGNDSVEL